MTNIFFIVPFRPGFNFMFLHLKHFIESNFSGAKCVRGDTDISSGILINKIRSSINEADVVIADCSGSNPNVLYEVGVAHALNKPVIMIHNSEEKEIPIDLRPYERIAYAFDDEPIFCEKLKNALQGVVWKKYDILYQMARELMIQFNRDSRQNVPIKSAEEFRAVLMSRESVAKPPDDDRRKLSAYLIPIIADGVLDLELATEMKEWVDRTVPMTAPSGGSS